MDINQRLLRADAYARNFVVCLPLVITLSSVVCLWNLEKSHLFISFWVTSRQFRWQFHRQFCRKFQGQFCGKFQGQGTTFRTIFRQLSVIHKTVKVIDFADYADYGMRLKDFSVLCFQSNHIGNDVRSNLVCNSVELC